MVIMYTRESILIAEMCRRQGCRPLYDEQSDVNPLTPNDHYSGRTAPLTSERCILYIYSTNNRYWTL